MTTATIYETLQLPGSVDPADVEVTVELVAAVDPDDPNLGYTAAPATVGGRSSVTPDATGRWELEGVAPNVRDAVSAPEYRAISAAAVTTDPATLTLDVAKPTGVVAGDWLLLAAFVGSSTSFSPNTTDTVATPSGWTLVAGPIVSTGSGAINNVKGYLFKKLVDGSEDPAFTLTKTGTEGRMRGVCVAIAGAGDGVDVCATGVASASSDVTIPNAAATAADELSLAIIGIRGTLNAGTPPSGWTERQDSANSNTPNCLVATKARDAAGNTGTDTYDLTTSNTWVAFHVLMKASDENEDAIATPEGTAYLVKVRWDFGGYDDRHIEVPDGAGPYLVEDLLVTAPSSVVPGGAMPSSARVITTTDQSVSIPNSTQLATVIDEGTAFPGSAVEGQLFRRTDLGITYRYSGLTWVAWSDAASETAYTPADRIVAEADTDLQAAVDRLEAHLVGGPGLPQLAGPQLRRFKTDIANRAAWPINQWLVGNSITSDYYAGAHADAWHQVYADRLAERLGLATNAHRYLPFRPGAAHPYDPWTYGAGVAANNDSSSGDPGYGIGRWSADIPSGGDITTTTDVLCDRVQLVYAKTSGLGTAELYIDGVLEASVATAGTSRSTFVLDSGALPLGLHEVKVMANGAAIIAEGCYVHASDYAGVRTINCSKAGATTLHFNALGTTGAGPFDGMADTFPPSIVIFELGSNDISFSLGVDSIRAQLQEQIDTINATAPTEPSIVLVVSPPNAYDQVPWENLIAAMYLLAQDYPEQVCVLDLERAMGTTETGDFHTGSPDTTHPGPLGHLFWGETVAAWVLQAIGAPPQVINGGTP